MQGLADGLIDRRGIKVEQRADARGHRWTQMRDVVNLVLVQADRLGEIDLHLVASGDPADELLAGQPLVLRHSEDRRDVVTGV